jgi:hypothetical protein
MPQCEDDKRARAPRHIHGENSYCGGHVPATQSAPVIVRLAAMSNVAAANLCSKRPRLGFDHLLQARCQRPLAQHCQRHVGCQKKAWSRLLGSDVSWSFPSKIGRSARRAPASQSYARRKHAQETRRWLYFQSIVYTFFALVCKAGIVKLF